MKAAATLLLAMALTAPSLASAQAQAAPPPTCRLDTSATVVNYNTRVRLDWQSANATGGYLTDVGSIAPSGWAYVVPGRNTTYAASFTGPGGTVVCRAAIAVRSGGVGAPVNTNQPIDTNTPVPLTQTVDLGGNVTLPAAPSFDAPSGSGFSGGIVPAECRGRSTVANCDLCSLAQLGQNAANFLLGLSIPAAALLFAWAGIMYFSARGNTGQIQKAHTIFRSVVIGFVIAVSAWVLVITAMNMLIHGKDFQGWSWQNLDCTQTRLARRYNMSLTAFLGTLSVKYETNNAPVNGGAGGGGATRGFSLTPEQEDKYTAECASGDANSCNILDLVGQPTYGAAGACASGSVYQQDYSDSSLGSCYNPITDAVSDPIYQAGGGVAANYTSEQNIWLSACRQGDVESCRSFSASTGSGDLGVRIAAATQQYMNTDTSSGPDGGNKACAWAVNNILRESGVAPVDGASVFEMQEQLRNGRGTLVGTDSNLANTQQGDIVVWKTSTMSHVGICENDGCSRVASNSSANARFTNITSASFNGRSTANIYRVNN